MKKLSIFLVLMFCVVLSQNTAEAVLGVDDNVPGQDLVFPIICGVTASLDTSWSIAETMGMWDGIPDGSGNAATAHAVVSNSRGTVAFDYDIAWTPFDVTTGNCKGLIQAMPSAAKALLKKTIDGTDYYVGFLEVLQQPVGLNPVKDRFTGWVSVKDGMNVTGFKPFQAESGLYVNNPDSDHFAFAEGANLAISPVTAQTLTFRYSIDNSGSKNWLILFTGIQSVSNGRSVSLPSMICNEEEFCLSIQLPVADLVNVYNVANYLPGGLSQGFPRRGFLTGELQVRETPYGVPYTPSDVSTFAWSYLDNCNFVPLWNRAITLSCSQYRRTYMFPADRTYFQAPQ